MINNIKVPTYFLSKYGNMHSISISFNLEFLKEPSLFLFEWACDTSDNLFKTKIQVAGPCFRCERLSQTWLSMS